jgi:hypothetical protein
MTLAVPKTGLVVEKTRALFLTDIGLPEGAYRQIGVTFRYRGESGSGSLVRR